MNYAGAFDFGSFETSAAAAEGGAIVVADAQLLFGGDYARRGSDLVLSKDGHDQVVPDYFKGSLRKALSAPDGATLSPDIVKALLGEVQLAQAGAANARAAQVIGTVSKLTGSATAIRNGVSITLNVGDNVQKGDVVQAGADSALSLTFIDGTVFGLSANARMVLNEMVYDPQGANNASLLSLVQGTITFVAGETAHSGNMRVDTPVATMGIRGTAVLVEIGFEVQGQGGAPVKFQVLVEPGGRVGNYVLYNKSTGAVMGTVNQAGQVTSVTGTGDTSIAPADALSPIAQAIIQQTLQQYFPNYVPDANPRPTPPGGGSAPATPVPGGSNPDPIKFVPPTDLPIGQPTTVPVNLPGEGGKPTTVTVTVTALNTAPTITVSALAISAAAETTGFKLADRVSIVDPDAANPLFNDVAVPYVAGTGRVLSAVGPLNLPAGLSLASLIHIAPATGLVTYDPAAFKFLAEGAQAVFTIGFDSRSGPDTLHETLTFTITGVNDAPVITHASLAVAQGGATIVQLSDIGITDPDSTSFFYYATATHGQFEKLIDGRWTVISGSDPVSSADIAAGLVRFHHDGSGDAPDITVLVSDGSAFSAPAHVQVDFSQPDTVLHLTSTAGTSIDLSGYGATSGFTLPGEGNATVPGTPEDRITLGYKIAGQTTVVTGAPMMGDKQFTPISHQEVTNNDGAHAVVTALDAGHGVTLTQTVTLGTDASYFTTTIDIFNNGTTTVDGVRFMRNIDPDQDHDQHNSFQTFNDVIHNPTGPDDVAIVEAKGAVTGDTVALIGLGGDWRASSFGFTNTDPYAAGAYDSPVDPNGQQNDTAISLTYQFGSIAPGQHASVTYITTNNVADDHANALYGTEQSDWIDGKGGDDILIGLGGADVFVFGANSGHDTIIDFKPGTDRINLKGGNDFVPTETAFQQWLSTHGSALGGDTLIRLDEAAHDTILLKNVALAQLHVGDFSVIT